MRGRGGKLEVMSSWKRGNSGEGIIRPAGTHFNLHHLSFHRCYVSFFVKYFFHYFFFFGRIGF